MASSALTFNAFNLKATSPQAQALLDDTVMMTPFSLAEAFKGGNQLLTGASNFQKLPGGFIVQMGVVTANQTADATPVITLPTSFITDLLGFSAISRNPASNNTAEMIPQYKSHTLGTITLHIASVAGGPPNPGFYWIALGK
jgi:hypothetical protein